MKKLLLLISVILITNVVFSQSHKKLTYYDNGNKKELLSYYDNQLNGKCIAWNEKGVMIGKVFYKNGMKDGKWFIWYNNGIPAYKFYYKKNKKVGVWKYYNEQGLLVAKKEYDPIFQNKTMINIGTFTLNDISLSVTQRINKNKLWAFGGEYSTYYKNGELENFVKIEKFQKHAIFGTGGLISHEWVFLLKAGTNFGYNYDEYLRKKNYFKFDYGCEGLLFFDDEMKISPVYGISLTKESGFQFKFGIIF